MRNDLDTSAKQFMSSGGAMLKCFHQLNIQTLIDNAPTEGESPGNLSTPSAASRCSNSVYHRPQSSVRGDSRQCVRGTV